MWIAISILSIFLLGMCVCIVKLWKLYIKTNQTLNNIFKSYDNLRSDDEEEESTEYENDQIESDQRPLEISQDDNNE